MISQGPPQVPEGMTAECRVIHLAGSIGADVKRESGTIIPLCTYGMADPLGRFGNLERQPRMVRGRSGRNHVH